MMVTNKYGYLDADLFADLKAALKPGSKITVSRGAAEKPIKATVEKIVADEYNNRIIFRTYRARHANGALSVGRYTGYTFVGEGWEAAERGAVL